MPVPMVFISSTFLDFQEERKIIRSKLTDILPVGCKMAEKLSCSTPNLDRELKRWIDDSDIVVLLLGFRYGSVVRNISWTEKEIRYAKKQNKKILPYEKEQQPPSVIVDVDVEKERALNEFKSYIHKNVSASIPRFLDMLDLIGLIVRDVQNVKYQFDKEDFQDSFI